MKMRALTAGAALLAAVSVGLGLARAAGAETIVFPPRSGMFNVVADGGLDNTGKTDCTEKIQKWILQQRGNQQRKYYLYFPKGTYLVSGSLCMKIDRSRSPASHSHGPHIIGESRTETIIRLKDGTWPEAVYSFPPKGDDKWPGAIDKQVVLNTGDCTNTTFDKVIRNLTINIGSNNAGAIGVQYNASNSGYLGEVDIVSEDGRGLVGLALAGVENGPAQVRNLRIKGFDLGIYGRTSYVYPMSHVQIEGARTAGLINRGKLACENWTVAMATDAPAIIQNGKWGAMAVIGAFLHGKGSARPAVVNEAGMLYLRDIKTTGFAGAFEGKGDDLAEHHVGKAGGMFNKTLSALKLPIKKQPLVPYETDFSKWANIMDHGAKGDSGTDDTAALQKALNDPGKTHVMIPAGRRFRIKGQVTVGPDVVRIVGGELLLSPQDNAMLTIADGKSPVVVLDDIKCSCLTVTTDRTVVLNSVAWYTLPRATSWHFEGGGEVFINDTGAAMEVTNPRCRIWIRHYNNENGQEAKDLNWAPVHVKAGTVWMLGWKSENLRRRVIVEKDGVFEMIGFNNYDVGRIRKDGDWPIFDVRDGQFSCAVLSQSGSRHNRNLVWETRNGEKRVFDIPANGGSRDCALYAGYED